MKDPKWLKKEQKNIKCKSILVPRTPGPGSLFLKGCGAEFTEWKDGTRHRIHADNCQRFNYWLLQNPPPRIGEV